MKNFGSELFVAVKGEVIMRPRLVCGLVIALCLGAAIAIVLNAHDLTEGRNGSVPSGTDEYVALRTERP